MKNLDKMKNKSKKINSVEYSEIDLVEQRFLEAIERILGEQ